MDTILTTTLEHVRGGATLQELADQGRREEFDAKLSQLAPWWNPRDIKLHWLRPSGWGMK
jgi:hypothetical protein